MLFHEMFISLVILALSNGAYSTGKGDMKCENGNENCDCSEYEEFVCEFTICEIDILAKCWMDGCNDCEIKFRPFLSNISLTMQDCKPAEPDRRCKATKIIDNCKTTTIDECKSNRDCSVTQMCCRNGCKHVCVDQVLDVKGVCPSAPVDYCKESSCTVDVECPYSEKCCRSKCGLTCMRPVPENTKKCKDGSKEFNCLLNPCWYISCPAYPYYAECKPDYCGGCNADFFDENNKKIDCDFLGPNKSCRCFVNPCSYARCPSLPNVECKADWCKCEAKFYQKGKEVNCTEICQPCNGDPCEGRTCPRNQKAKCKSNTCNCTSQFVDNKNEPVEC